MTRWAISKEWSVVVFPIYNEAYMPATLQLVKNNVASYSASKPSSFTWKLLRNNLWIYFRSQYFVCVLTNSKYCDICGQATNCGYSATHRHVNPAVVSLPIILTHFCSVDVVNCLFTALAWRSPSTTTIIWTTLIQMSAYVLPLCVS